MTGIFVYKNKVGNRYPKKLVKTASKIGHRGQFNKHVVKKDDFFMKVFLNRPQKKNGKLSFKDEETGKKIHVALDGELVNIREILLELSRPVKENPSTNEILYLGYKEWGNDIFKKLNGPYSLLMDVEDKIIAAKDPVGFNPLYVLENDKELVISSELKALNAFSGKPKILQPGQVFSYADGNIKYDRFFNIEHLAKKKIESSHDVQFYKRKLFNLLKKAVEKSIDANHEVAALLSGGIDSTIICALATIFITELDVYTVAYEGSEDLKYAKLFADRHKYDVNHHVYEIKLDDMLSLLPDVIYHLETFDAALIRSAIPMYFISSKVKDGTDILLTGEGGDELFGGYSYLSEMKPKDLKDEFIEMLKIEHATGLQRVDRIPYGHEIEARAPWFDLDLVKFSFEIPMGYKIKKVKDDFVEKWIERETFRHIIPHEIADRKKAKFSKGVGSQFILRDHFANLISDEEFQAEQEVIPNVKVKSKEELHYWRIFEDLFNPNEDFVRQLPRTAEFIV